MSPSPSMRRERRDFDRITAENVKKRLAIVLDDIVYSAPVIQERISGGKAQITGSFSDEEAKDLAIVLRAGALPAPVRILEQVTVGPSLGQDSIEKGVWSILIGFALVVVFMICLLQVVRRGCEHRAVPERDPHSRDAGHLQGDPYPSRARRNRPHHRYGGGRQRPDLRAGPRRDPGGQDAARRDRGGLQQGPGDDSGLQYHDPDCGRVPVPVRDGADQGIRHHLEHRTDLQHVHGGVRLQDHLRLLRLEQENQSAQHIG